MTVLAVAHRAGNALHSLRAAVDAGAHVLEADVHGSRDRLEVRHLKPLGPLPSLWDRSCPLPSARDRWQLVRRTPQLRLEELLAAARGGATLMLDLKGVGGVGPAVARTLHERAPQAPVIVCARWWPSLAAFEQLPWARPVLSARGPRELAGLRRRLDRRPPPYGVSVHRSLLDATVVAELRKRVDVVMTWPVNDAASLDRALGLGVTGIISDDPEVLRAVVSAAD